MNREEYMKSLRYKLRRLPREDYDKAIAYFEEYFEEAGPEHETEAIEDLGTPEMAADSIIRDFAVENAIQPEQNVKRNFSKVWVGILAVCAAPIGLPLALTLAAVLLVIILVVVSLIFSIFILGLALTLSIIPCVVGSICIFPGSPANAIATLGLGLISVGIGIWAIMGCIALCNGFLHLMTRLFGRIAKGGKRHHEN